MRYGYCRLAGIICLGLAQAGVYGDVSATDGYKPQLKDMLGVVHGNDLASTLWGKVLTWDRHDMLWGNCEPAQGEWDEAYFKKLCDHILMQKARGVTVLPILCYNTHWSWNRQERSFIHQGQEYHISPRPDGRFDLEIRPLDETQSMPAASYQVQNFIPGVDTQASVQDGNWNWPLDVKYLPDWERYVERVVSTLRQPPYELEYFQIWNEAWPTSGFWFGSVDEFMETIYLPAARIIRKHDGKVVYGAWPCCGTIKEFTALLDQYDAWKVTDVLDVHYFPLSALELLYQETQQRGYTLPIWQTEIGLTRDVGFIGNFYPRFMHWALSRHWHSPDQYRLFYFCWWSPDDPKSWAYDCTLLNGERYTPHGTVLQTLAQVFDGPLSRYKLESSPTLNAEINENLSSMEGFRVGRDKIVAAIHLIPNNEAMLLSDWNGDGDTLHLNFGRPAMQVMLDEPRVVSARRVDLAGHEDDLTLQQTQCGHICVSVPLFVSPDSPMKDWPVAKVRTFFVVFNTSTTQAEVAQ